VQFLWRSWRAGRPFWRTLSKGAPPLEEGRDLEKDLELPLGAFVREFLTGGVNYPWTLSASVAVGIALMLTGPLLGTTPPIANSDHIAGCLAITIAVSAMAEVIRSVRFLNLLLGLWVAASPFLLDGGGTAAMIGNALLGLGLVALSLPRGTRSEEHYGGWDRYIV
jgi:hypothetical protein